MLTSCVSVLIKNVNSGGFEPETLCMTVASWCVSRATFTTLNPKDKVYSEVIEKFKRQVFINNVMRIKAVILGRTQRDIGTANKFLLMSSQKDLAKPYLKYQLNVSKTDYIVLTGIMIFCREVQQ